MAPEPKPAVAAAVESEPVVEVVPTAAVEPAPEPAVVDAVTGRATVDVRGEEPVIELAPADGVDHVLRALVERVRITHQDVVEAATELVERANLDAEEAAEVLSDLIDRAEDERLAVGEGRDEELMFFSDEVPRRPGQLTHFAELEDREKRRVIIRVLCLLVAANLEERAATQRRTDDSTAGAAGVGGEPAKAWPLARAVWPVPAAEEADDLDLPARRSRTRLARSRR
jgi:polyhydroxyalkanoate synthesis regulator phasin